MKKRISWKARPVPQPVKTGEHCPVIGWWAPSNSQDVKRFVTEGSIMPPDKGQSVTWKLVASAGIPGSRLPLQGKDTASGA